MSPDRPQKPQAPQSAKTHSSPLGEQELATGADLAPPSLLRHATVQRALANPRCLSPAEVIQLQRTVGNRAVQQMLNPAQSQTSSPQSLPVSRLQRKQSAPDDQGEREVGSMQAGPQLQRSAHADKAISPAPDLSIQRKINFAPDSLAGNLSYREKFNARLGKKSPLAELQEKLSTYFTIDSPAEEYALLTSIRTLAAKWLGKRSNKDSKKTPAVTNLLIEISKEIPRLQKILIADTRAQGRYLNLVQSKNLKYLTELGAQTADAMSDLHVGKDRAEPQFMGRSTAIQQFMREHGLTLAEATAIGIYSAQDYMYMNPALKGDNVWMQKMLPKTQLLDKQRDQQVKTDISGGGLSNQQLGEISKEGNLHSKMALSGLKKLPDRTVNTFRGEIFTYEEFSERFNFTKPLVFPAFTSTSTDLSSAEDFLVRVKEPNINIPILLRLHVTKGKDIQPLTMNPKEGEVLLLPGATFQVVNITHKQITEGTAEPHKRYIVDLIQVS